MAVSRLVREARLRANLSQAELARRAGVAKSTVGRMKRALARPRPIWSIVSFEPPVSRSKRG